MKEQLTRLSRGPPGRGSNNGELQSLCSVHDAHGSVTPANCGNADLVLPNLPFFQKNLEV